MPRAAEGIQKTKSRPKSRMKNHTAIPSTKAFADEVDVLAAEWRKVLEQLRILAEDSSAMQALLGKIG
jgi:hypothetical protein